MFPSPMCPKVIHFELGMHSSTILFAEKINLWREDTGTEISFFILAPSIFCASEILSLKLQSSFDCFSELEKTTSDKRSIFLAISKLSCISLTGSIDSPIFENSSKTYQFASVFIGNLAPFICLITSSTEFLFINSKAVRGVMILD